MTPNIAHLLSKTYRSCGSAAVVAIFLFVARAQPQISADQTPSDSVERFALLIGVNDYLQPSDPRYKVTPLKGPANDVALMKDLITARYRFKDDRTHILQLVGKNATHEGIKKTFKEQLIVNAAKHPGAIVLFYFSGHGSQADHVDHFDESQHVTLVAYDSRSDKGTDVIDTELADLFEELRTHTTNITFILDSCHSGNAIKDVSTLISRELPSNPHQGRSPSRLRDVATSSAVDHLIPRRQQYALLSSSRAEERSYEDPLMTPQGEKYHGLFTYHLSQTLRQEPNVTNERAMQNASQALSKTRVSSYQHPLPVGNLEGYVLGGGDRDDPYVEMLSPPDEHGEFEIKAGTNLGMREGTFLAIYSEGTRRFLGESGKLANARVKKLGGLQSIAVLSETPVSPITLRDKVAIVTPYYGFEPLRIRLVDLPGQETTAGDRTILSKARDLLAPNALIRLTGPAEAWDVAFRRGCVADGRIIAASDIPRDGGACTAIFYLTDSQLDKPLLGFYALTNTPDVANRLQAIAERRAKQENVRGLDNAVSPMKGQVRLRLIKVAVQRDQNGRPLVVPEAGQEFDGSESLRIGQNFVLRVENNTSGPIYAAVFMLGTSGAVELISSDPHGELIRKGLSSTITQVPRLVGPPVGLETYKVFASTSPTVDYRVLEQPGGKSATASPLEWLLNQTTNIRTRDSTPNQSLNLSDWSTANLDIIVKQ